MSGRDHRTNLPAPGQSPTDELVIRSRRDLDRLSDEDLLGTDYRAWLNEEKEAVQETLESGESIRARAARAMARSEELLRKAKGDGEC